MPLQILTYCEVVKADNDSPSKILDPGSQGEDLLQRDGSQSRELRLLEAHGSEGDIRHLRPLNAWLLKSWNLCLSRSSAHGREGASANLPLFRAMADYAVPCNWFSFGVAKLFVVNSREMGQLQ